MVSKKIIMLGMWGVGKTSLVQQFVHSMYDDKYLSTIGVKIDKKEVALDSGPMKLMLWDVAGAEDDFNVPPNFVRGAAGYLLVLDSTRPESLLRGLDLIHMVRDNVGDIPFITVVNKSDLPSELSDADINKSLERFSQPWFRSSAKTGENVELVFKTLAEMIA